MKLLLANWFFFWLSAIEGTLNVLRQAEKAGVKKFVVTSSISALMGDPALKGVAYGSERRLFSFTF